MMSKPFWTKKAGGKMELDLAINDSVEVKAPGIRLGQRGRVVDRFARTRPLYAVQFPDNCVGYFERPELEKVPLGEGSADGERDTSFQDVTDVETGFA